MGKGENAGYRQVTKVGVLLRQLKDIAVIDIFNKKRECCNHQCPDSGYQHFLLFPQVFQKASYTGSLKVGIVW